MRRLRIDAIFDRAVGSREDADAVALYREILDQDPGHERARYNLAVLLETLGKTEEAFEHFRWLHEQRSWYADLLWAAISREELA